MRRFLIILLFHPFFVSAQNGVHFIKDLSLSKVKEIAKTENKFIFIDCYASWCGPCKDMDSIVYPLDSVGNYLNKNFIAIKVQCDTSKRDLPNTISWYTDAHNIVSEYKIDAYPTYLFLSPDGKIVHKGLGYLKPAEFISLAKDALNPDKQFYTVLDRYNGKIKDFSLASYLVTTAKDLGNKVLAQSIALDYMKNYLDKLSDAAFCTKENFRFFASNPQILSSTERVFDWYFHRSLLVDSVMEKKDYSVYYINYIVYKEEVAPAIINPQNSAKAPDWEKMSALIESKFGYAYVEGNILRGKVKWYKDVKDWKNYSKYLFAKLERDSIENTQKNFSGLIYLNGAAWEMFSYSDDKKQLEKAILWSDRAIEIVGDRPGNSGVVRDTKANLLYKLGKKDEAIAIEKIALKFDPQSKDIKENLAKMEDGKPTW